MANVDRSARNTNLLIWHKTLWAIDHGACLRFHHAWGRPTAFAESPYDYGDHVLSGRGRPRSVHAEMAAGVTPELLDGDLDQRARRLARSRSRPDRIRRRPRTHGRGAVGVRGLSDWSGSPRRNEWLP